MSVGQRADESWENKNIKHDPPKKQTIQQSNSHSNSNRQSYATRFIPPQKNLKATLRKRKKKIPALPVRLLRERCTLRRDWRHDRLVAPKRMKVVAL